MFVSALPEPSRAGTSGPGLSPLAGVSEVGGVVQGRQALGHSPGGGGGVSASLVSLLACL